MLGILIILYQDAKQGIAANGFVVKYAMDGLAERISQTARLIADSSGTAAFTGAGISTESGISDFRSPGGVWDRYRIVTYQEFLDSREARMEYWAMKRDLFREMSGARPNRAHEALARMERMGRLSCLITQNIDGLHQDAGSSPGIVIEIHGTNRRAACLGCGRVWPIEEIQELLEKGELDPRCEDCGGYIKPATISFGQSMPVEEMERAYLCARQCGVMLMIGSSLQVEPAASIPPLAHQGGAALIFVNRTPTQWDHLASVLFHEPAGEVLGSIADLLSRTEPNR